MIPVSTWKILTSYTECFKFTNRKYQASDFPIDYKGTPHERSSACTADTNSCNTLPSALLRSCFPLRNCAVVCPPSSTKFTLTCITTSEPGTRISHLSFFSPRLRSRFVAPFFTITIPIFLMAGSRLSSTTMLSRARKPRMPDLATRLFLPSMTRLVESPALWSIFFELEPWPLEAPHGLLESFRGTVVVETMTSSVNSSAMALGGSRRLTYCFRFISSVEDKDTGTFHHSPPVTLPELCASAFLFFQNARICSKAVTCSMLTILCCSSSSPFSPPENTTYHTCDTSLHRAISFIFTSALTVLC
mmetsp:Transcript_4563/g.11128  ORF Transcript_4563/g.11128 Transcript_4563/m.11128 type:complete len:304 (-) Transcript_4563:232-1143(-)